MRHRAVQSLTEGKAVSRSTAGNLHMEMKAITRSASRQPLPGHRGGGRPDPRPALFWGQMGSILGPSHRRLGGELGGEWLNFEAEALFFRELQNEVAERESATTL